MLEKRFAFPINLKEIFINRRIGLGWFEEHAEVIHEVYVDPAFMGIHTKDMNGPNTNVDPDEVIQFLLDIKSIGIKVCVVINDIFSNTDELYNQFKGLYPSYAHVVDMLVVPNSGWLRLKDDYPDLIIKNTVINLPTFEQVRDGEYDAYDIIYIHNDIIHNHDKWLDIKGNRRFGTVVNFGECLSICPLKQHHYERVQNGTDFPWVKFNCPTKTFGIVERQMKRCSIPGYLVEFEYYSDVIDVFKLQGRNNTLTFPTAIDIVESVYNNSKKTFGGYEVMDFVSPITRHKWRKHVRNCGGNCVNCNWCDNILKELRDKHGDRV